MNRTAFLLIGIAVLIFLGAWFSLQKNSESKTDSEHGALASHAQTANSKMFATPDQLDTTTETISYYKNTNGFYVAPSGADEYPGVVMIHEWWGLNDNIRDMAKLLASQGYRVLAVDLFNGQVAKTPDEARSQTSALDKNEALNNMKAAKVFLAAKGSKKIATLGWCFGGGQSLALALSGEALDATVIYYGQLETDETKLTSIKWPVLGIFGDQDQSIPVDTVNKFKATLDKLNIINVINIYPGVGHAFANPSGPNYAEAETRDAWENTLAFLEKTLK